MRKALHAVPPTSGRQQKQQHVVGSVERVGDKEGVDLGAEPGGQGGEVTPAARGRQTKRTVWPGFEQTSTAFKIDIQEHMRDGTVIKCSTRVTSEWQLRLLLASTESSAVVEEGTETPSSADNEAVRADRERG